MSAASTLQNPRNVATGATTNENFLAGVTRALQKKRTSKSRARPSHAMPVVTSTKNLSPSHHQGNLLPGAGDSPFTFHCTVGRQLAKFGFFYRFTYGKDVPGFQVSQAQGTSNSLIYAGLSYQSNKSISQIRTKTLFDVKSRY